MESERKTVKFGQIILEATRNGIYKKKEFHGSGVKIVNMGELFSHPRLYAIPMKRVELTKEEVLKFCLITGDLLFARRSLVAEGAGKCTIVMEIDENTTFESSIIRVRPDPTKADSLFLYYLFSSPYGRYLLGTIRRQVAVAGITGSDLTQLEISIPLLPEQRAVSHILGTLDDKMELNRRMNETLGAIARAIFKSWFVDFDPVIDNALRAGNPVPRALAEKDARRRELLSLASAEGRGFGLPKYIADLFPVRFEDSQLGDIPMGWKVRRVGDVLRAVGGSTPSTTKPSYWDDGKYYWATPKDLSNLAAPILLHTERKITEAGLAQISSGLLPAGTVLMSSRAPVGYLALASVQVAINQGFIAMICDGPVSNYYVLNWCHFNMEEIKQRASGTTFAEISKVAYRPIAMLIPDERALKIYTDCASVLYRAIKGNIDESRTLASLRDTLLPKLISGAVRVREVEKLMALFT